MTTLSNASNQGSQPIKPNPGSSGGDSSPAGSESGSAASGSSGDVFRKVFGDGPTRSPTDGRRGLNLPPTTTLGWLRDMLLIREFEIRCMQAYQEKKIGGFCHVYIGQEAVAVGCTAAVDKRDPIITAYRDHGHALARGMDPRHCMAEMFGRLGGCAKGKGGSMHMFDRANNLMGGHGIVGAQTPMGAGIAFACKYEDEVLGNGANSRVTLCFLGDGALNQGAFHEAMNLAGLLNLPVIFVVENNGYSMGTSIARGTTMAHNLMAKAQAYGINGYTTDGMDVLTVHADMKAIVQECRSASRPAFVDIRTYRYKGHSMSDPRKYRSKEEEEVFEADDPIGKLQRQLQAAGVLTEAAFKEMQKSVKEQVREAVQWSDASPSPGADELYRDVCVEEWGPYTGSTQPEMLGGAPNLPTIRTIEPNGEVS